MQEAARISVFTQARRQRRIHRSSNAQQCTIWKKQMGKSDFDLLDYRVLRRAQAIRGQ